MKATESRSRTSVASKNANESSDGKVSFSLPSSVR
jgi:hypothetical protein